MAVTGITFQHITLFQGNAGGAANIGSYGKTREALGAGGDTTRMSVDGLYAHRVLQKDAGFDGLISEEAQLRQGYLAFGRPPRRHGCTQRERLVRLDPGRGPGTDFDQMDPGRGPRPGSNWLKHGSKWLKLLAPAQGTSSDPSTTSPSRGRELVQGVGIPFRRSASSRLPWGRWRSSTATPELWS